VAQQEVTHVIHLNSGTSYKVLNIDDDGTYCLKQIGANRTTRLEERQVDLFFKRYFSV